MVGALRAALPDLQVTVEDLLAEGDKVALRLRGRGTHRGPFAGVAPTGRPVALTSMELLRLAGGKLVEHWDEFDTLGVLQQLGAIPAPRGGQPVAGRR
jgi:predicted ester cyclase